MDQLLRDGKSPERAFEESIDGIPYLTVLRPDGREYRGLSRNVLLVNGQWEGRLPLALNDMPGTWRAVARDVATGVEGEATFVAS